MYHDCLEKIYRAIRAGKVKSVKELPALLGEIEREYLKEMPKDAKSREIVEDGLLRIEPLMLAYFTHYVNDFSIPWVTVEGRFTCDLAPKIKITGTMDGGFHNQKGLFCVFESKFRSRIDAENIADVLALDLQLSFYTAAARAYGYKVGPRRFNIVKKPAQRVKKGETKKAFSARVFAEIMENPRDYFFRFDSPISPREQQVSTYRLTGLCSTYLAWWKSLQARPQEPTILDHLANPGQCDGKYGPCEYLSLCAQGDLSLYVKTDPQARKVQSFEDLPKPKPEKAPKR